jgi:hypothetical protein
MFPLGCLIWWFAPKCPLANIFGPDPLRIYPWGKFCKIYSDFQGTEVCPETKTVEEELKVLASPKKLKRSAPE